jgi:hypothetical protein
MARAELVRLAAQPPGAARQPEPFVGQLEGAMPGEPADVVCPLCQGVLTQTPSGAFEHFRCHVGHTFSMESLVRDQS